MYSVLTISIDPSSFEHLLPVAEDLSQKLTTTIPAMKVVQRARGDGLSIELSSADDWTEHCRRVAQAVTVVNEGLAAARLIGAHVSWSIAVEPEDYERPGRTLISLDRNTLRLLTSASIEFAVTVY